MNINMKQFFYTILFVTISFVANAQKESRVIASNLIIIKTGENMQLNWISDAGSEGSWEVQGSKDGKEFSTIGLVWGADPKAASNSFAFKQKLSKVQQKYAYYRVMYTEDNTTVRASKTVEFSK